MVPPSVEEPPGTFAAQSGSCLLYTSWLQRALALFLCVAALEAVQAAPQDTKRTITGTVVDQNNLPVVGATVMISNSANGTATDSNGQFTLSGVTDNDELQISFLGYKTVTMQVGTRTAIAATLEEDSGYLDEVVVVGLSLIHI